MEIVKVITFVVILFTGGCSGCTGGTTSSIFNCTNNIWNATSLYSGPDATWNFGTEQISADTLIINSTITIKDTYFTINHLIISDSGILEISVGGVPILTDIPFTIGNLELRGGTVILTSINSDANALLTALNITGYGSLKMKNAWNSPILMCSANLKNITTYLDATNTYYPFVFYACTKDDVKMGPFRGLNDNCEYTGTVTDNPPGVTPSQKIAYAMIKETCNASFQSYVVAIVVAAVFVLAFVPAISYFGYRRYRRFSEMSAIRDAAATKRGMSDVKS